MPKIINNSRQNEKNDGKVTCIERSAEFTPKSKPKQMTKNITALRLC